MAWHPALHNSKSPQTGFLRAFLLVTGAGIETAINIGGSRLRLDRQSIIYLWCPGPELNRHGT